MISNRSRCFLSRLRVFVSSPLLSISFNRNEHSHKLQTRLVTSPDQTTNETHLHLAQTHTYTKTLGWTFLLLTLSLSHHGPVRRLSLSALLVSPRSWPTTFAFVVADCCCFCYDDYFFFFRQGHSECCSISRNHRPTPPPLLNRMIL